VSRRARLPAETAVRQISGGELDMVAPALAGLLRDTVNAGAPLGFVPPVTLEACRRYFAGLAPELRGGSRLLFAAWSSDQIVGSGQLVLAPWPNARHRAEVQKLCVAEPLRGRGIGSALVHALHAAARRRGRWLLLLTTRTGGSEAFYERLGYREAGRIPDYSLGPRGEAYDHVTLYRRLERSATGRRRRLPTIGR
jgi:ribosomal protein S18 acetylase RimI-like enzyme